MTQLLQDVFIVENLQVLTEGKNSDTMIIKGVFGRCNEKNNNGRIYPITVLEGQLKKVQPLISERRLCGELDHPQNDTVKLSNASHLITKLEMKGNELIGEAEILKTPAGLTAKALIEGGVKIGISSRGMGTLSEDAQGNKIVNEDFRLVTFDLVADPSTRGAFPGLSESTQSQFARESDSKLEKECKFVTMLQSKLREAYDPWIEEAKKKGKTKKRLSSVNKKKEDLVGIDGSIIPQSDVCEGMKAVKEEGSWHQIAYALAEVFNDDPERDREREATELYKRLKASGNIGGDSGSMLGNIRARSHAKKMEIAKAKGARIGAKQLAKGDVEAARIRARGAAGGSVSMNPFSPGRQSYAQETRAMQQRSDSAPNQETAPKPEPKPGVKSAPEAVKPRPKPESDSAPNQETAPKPEPKPGVKSAPEAVKPRPKPEAVKPEPQAKKPGISDEEKYQRKALGQADLKKATADVAGRAKKGAEGQFGAGVGRDDKASMQKAIARRERKTGKEVNLTKQQALDLSHRIYSRMGYSLAEAFGLIESAGQRQEIRYPSPGSRGNTGKPRAGGREGRQTETAKGSRGEQKRHAIERDMEGDSQPR